MRVDPGEVGFDHHVGGDARLRRVHAPGAEQRLDLPPHLLGGDVHVCEYSTRPVTGTSARSTQPLSESVM